MYSNIGNVYYNQGEDSKALEYFLQSLKISEEINDTLRTTTALINIGAVFANKSITYPQALKYLGRALPLSLAIDDLTTYGTACVNIGEIWLNSNEYDSAQVYFEKAAKAYDGTEDLPYALNDLGKVYQMRQEYDAAYRYQKQAYDIAKSLDLRNDMAISMLGIAKTLQLRAKPVPPSTPTLKRNPWPRRRIPTTASKRSTKAFPESMRDWEISPRPSSIRTF